MHIDRTFDSYIIKSVTLILLSKVRLSRISIGRYFGGYPLTNKKEWWGGG